MMRSWVSVPVLSVHSTSIAPKFWIASSRLTITCLRDSASAPLARFIVTSMGSISGVSPTATALANSSASSQSPLVRPLMMNTSGTITAMKRSISHVKRFSPKAKLLGPSASVIDCAMPPNTACAPVCTTTAVAVPLATCVPMNAMLRKASVSVPGASTSGYFSTGRDSPVRADSLTKKSRADSTRTSAGTRSPADRCTTSPGTNCAIGTSRVSVPVWPPRSAALATVAPPRRKTVAVVCTIARKA